MKSNNLTRISLRSPTFISYPTFAVQDHHTYADMQRGVVKKYVQIHRVNGRNGIRSLVSSHNWILFIPFKFLLNNVVTYPVNMNVLSLTSGYIIASVFL